MPPATAGAFSFWSERAIPAPRSFRTSIAAAARVFMHVAEAVGAWARESQGQSGFGMVGAVVGATYPAELAAIRSRLPAVWFLIPGYGAQGGAAADTAPAFNEEGIGAVVNNSRGIISSFDPKDRNWEASIETATKKMIADLVAATPMAGLVRHGASHCSRRL